jgi:hypothetical protein
MSSNNKEPPGIAEIVKAYYGKKAYDRLLIMVDTYLSNAKDGRVTIFK